MCHTLIATGEGNARDALGGLWLHASSLAFLIIRQAIHDGA